MPSFQAKPTGLTKEGDTKNSYADLAVLALGHVPVNGFTILEMGTRLDLVKKLKDIATNGTVELTQEETEDLKNCTSEMRWRLLSEDIKAFGDYVASL